MAKAMMGKAGRLGKKDAANAGSPALATDVRPKAAMANEASAAAAAAAAAAAGANRPAAPPPSIPTCEHPNVVQADGEVVCTSCGTVIDDDTLIALHGCHDNDVVANSSMPQTWGGVDSESRPNLYVANSLGTSNSIPKMAGMQLLQLYCKGGIETDRDRRNKTRLSRFSNACEKMGFGQAQAQTAWTLFQRVAKTTSPRKAADAAAWSIYQTCKMYSIPASSDEILDVVKSNFGRKTMPNMLRILYSCMASSDESLAATVADRGQGGIADASSSSPSRPAARGSHNGGGAKDYYFALNMRRMLKGRRFTREMFSAAKNDAWRMYTEVFTTGNPNTRARRSIAMAFGMGT